MCLVNEKIINARPMRSSPLFSTFKKDNAMPPLACPLLSFISLQPSIGNSISLGPYTNVAGPWTPSSGLSERTHGHEKEAEWSVSGNER